MPEGKGIVFYPCVEYWRNSSDKYVISPLFQWYIFLRATLDKLQLHNLVKKSSAEINAYIKKLSKETALDSNSHNEIYDFSDDETSFLDFLLSFKHKENERSQENKIMSTPKEGVIRMSRGYEEKGKIKVIVYIGNPFIYYKYG